MLFRQCIAYPPGLTSLLLWFEVFAVVVVMLTELFIELALNEEEADGEQLGICRESCLESSLDCRTF